MTRYHHHPLPHLLGQVSYQGPHRFRPDGDTIHLREPVLLVDGKAQRPRNACFEVWMPGKTKAHRIQIKGGVNPYVPIRFEGLDAPEEHYQATAFKLKKGGKVLNFPIDPAKHEERSQPLWKPATEYVLKALQQKGGWALIALDREVVDKYGRVLGYVYTSDRKGKRGTFVSLELVRRGLAFPFLFESAGDSIPVFLAAANKARRKGLGVWRHYVDAHLSYAETYDSPQRYTDPEPPGQASASLNLPMVFRRIVDAFQLQGLTLSEALRKYDAIDYETGDLVPGDRYTEIPIESRIWAPHAYK
jgi:endonuclease YncB( thermonuclease family)